MEESGQTDAERRRLRQAQRNLQKKIIDNGEAMENASSEKFGEIRGKNNELFAKVAYTREAVLDGDNLEMIATHASRQVDALVQVRDWVVVSFFCDREYRHFYWGACFISYCIIQKLTVLLFLSSIYSLGPTIWRIAV